MGDQVIAEVGRRLQSGARTSDTVCRIGGDEFVIICEGFTDPQGPATLAGRLIDLVCLPMHVEGLDDAPDGVSVGLSVGIAHACDGEGAAELVARADAALYAAKAAGRGRAVLAGAH